MVLYQAVQASEWNSQPLEDTSPSILLKALSTIHGKQTIIFIINGHPFNALPLRQL